VTTVSDRPDLDELRRAAAVCTRCELYGPATQTVFGEGPASAWLVLVGEQPGDRGDVTNAVKHFRFEHEGKRRIHKTPGVTHRRACRHWLDGELAAVAPSALATLGAVAAKALLGSGFRISKQRGQVLVWEGRRLVPTVHPSAILRGPPEAREEALSALVADLEVVARLRL
jgi:uracil-DNA glycosylase